MTKKKKTTRVRRPKAAGRRRLSPQLQQGIKELAVSLGELIPATSQGQFSLTGIAKKRGLTKFILTGANKRRTFEHFITKMLRQHPVKLKTIINDALAEGVERRHRNGLPVLRGEADVLVKNLTAVGIDLKKEVAGLNLPTDRPHITPPPIQLQSAVEKIAINSLLRTQVFPLFKNGHTNDAARKAGEILEAELQRLSGLKDEYGRVLAGKCLSGATPTIDIAGHHSGKIISPGDEREGFQFLVMGALVWCKNLLGHGEAEQLGPHDAAARIVVISHLLDVLQKRK